MDVQLQDPQHFPSKAVCCNACLFGKYAGVMEPLTKQLLAKDVEPSNVKRVTNNLLHRLLFHRKVLSLIKAFSKRFA